METERKTNTFLNLLSSMDEDYYFHIATGILGTIHTPFNKQSLNRRILSFFANEENKGNIAASMDDGEKQLLGFVFLMGSANLQQLEAFCSNTNRYMLEIHIQNLCDRLILFKTSKGYIVNPLLEETFAPRADNTHEKVVPKKHPYVDSNVLRAVLSLILSGSAPQREANLHYFYKSGKLKAVFPQFETQPSIRMFELLRNLVLETGIVERNDFTKGSQGSSHMVVDRNACTEILSMSPLDICLAAVGSQYGKEVEDSTAMVLQVLMECPLETKMFKDIVAATSKVQIRDGFAEELEALGLIYSNDGTVFFNETILEMPMEMSALTIDSDLAVSYYGVPKANDVLYLFADIQKCDNLVEYAITKASFTRALGFGVTKDEIEVHLNDPKIGRVLEQWEQSASRVSLYDGIVLKCTKEVSFLVERIPELCSNVMAELGDGLYLMKRSTESVWGAVLSKALDMEAIPVPLCENPSHRRFDSKSFCHYGIKEMAKASAASKTTSGKSWNQVKKELMDDAMSKGCLSKELESLIEAKRIVSTSQIGKDFKYEKLPTAGGLDFNAKLSLIKKAVGHKTKPNLIPLRLELLEEEIIAVPLGIQGSGSTATLKAAILPNGDERMIPIGSIFQVTLTRSL